jgi:hypothetical protein
MKFILTIKSNHMKTKSILMSVLMLLACSVMYAQSNRGVYPRLLENGQVVDMNGRKLGTIRVDGKVMQKDDKVIALISSNGDVSFANGKGIAGSIQKNAFTSAVKNYIAVIDKDGVVTVNDDFAAFVDKGYPTPLFGSVLHFFFGQGMADATEVDDLLY